MLVLKVFPSAIGLKSPSPFSTKAIALMEMSGLDYTLQSADPRKMPNKKLPVLIDGSKQIPDSSHIQSYLAQQYHIDFDPGLDQAQLAISQAFRRLIEDHLYWVLVYSRWIDNGDLTRDFFFKSIPNPIRKLVFKMIVKQVRSALFHHGMGRHTPADIYAFGAADLKALSTHLKDKAFFFGDDPTSIDASLYGILSNIMVPPLESPLKSAALALENLSDYCRRFESHYNVATS